YRRGAIDKTLFIKKDRRDIMLVQVYVDDIIFGSTKYSMVKDFEDLMQKEFKMSSMGQDKYVEEPKKKKLTLQQIRALETTNDEEVARKIQVEWDAKEERKRLEELKKAKPKTTSLAQERNQMMNFLKGQGYKNLQKLKYPQMKELYDKVQESIKDSFKDFIPMGSEKEREINWTRSCEDVIAFACVIEIWLLKTCLR
ncbi:putative ribonuclease H-like domain-containing protein, partial [Tanacetum coccineum]